MSNKLSATLWHKLRDPAGDGRRNYLPCSIILNTCTLSLPKI
jgi:hypothetical protein